MAEPPHKKSGSAERAAPLMVRTSVSTTWVFADLGADCKLDINEMPHAGEDKSTLVDNKFVTDLSPSRCV